MVVANEKLYPQRLARFNKNPFCVSICPHLFFLLHFPSTSLVQRETTWAILSIKGISLIFHLSEPFKHLTSNNLPLLRTLCSKHCTSAEDVIFIHLFQNILLVPVVKHHNKSCTQALNLQNITCNIKCHCFFRFHFFLFCNFTIDFVVRIYFKI